MEGEHSSTKPVWEVYAVQKAHCTCIAALRKCFPSYPQAGRNLLSVKNMFKSMLEGPDSLYSAMSFKM